MSSRPGEEVLSGRKRRARRIESLLKKDFPSAAVALEYSTPLELLISVILSAQCTDARVNMVTPALFRRYRTPSDFAEADPAELETIIHSTGFYRNKAKNIIACCKALIATHGGTVPSTMDELLRLPGVGRKTANCVLSGAFNIAAGIIVDTHVQRVARRLGLTAQENPEKIEADLCGLIEQENWIHFGNTLVLHGRNVCKARNPQCAICHLNTLCPSAENQSK